MEEKTSQEIKLKKIMYGLIAVAAILLIALCVVWYERTSLVNDLNLDKTELTEQIVALQDDYSNLSSDYDNINMQLDSSREEVTQLIDRIKKTDATNRSKMRQYEKELGTLRSIMRNYIVQIDSLNTMNVQLKADAAAARKDAAASKRKSEELSKKVENLAGQVATGAVLKGRGLAIYAYNSSDRITDRSSRVKRLMVSLSLVENDLAEKGPVRVYIRVKDPDGILITGPDQSTFNFNEEPMIASASREVDFQGVEVDLSIYLNGVEEYSKGIYTVEAYSTTSLLGKAELMLR